MFKWVPRVTTAIDPEFKIVKLANRGERFRVDTTDLRRVSVSIKGTANGCRNRLHLDAGPPVGILHTLGCDQLINCHHFLLQVYFG